MKKALCIVGSPNRNGSTSKLITEAALGLADVGYTVNTFHLADMRIGYCTGCNGCVANRRCVQRDDMDILVAQLLDADVVCIGCPSWWGDVPAQLKTFIDRSLPLCDTRGGSIVPKGKLGISIAVRAGRSASENHHILETIEHYYGHLGIKAAARVHTEGVDTPEDLKPEVLAQAYEAGLNVSRFSEKRETPFGIRGITPADIPAVAEMNLGLIRDEGSDNRMTLVELEERMRGFLGGTYHGVIIETSGKTAGYCLYRPEEPQNGNRAGVYLRQYYIKREYRQYGLGRAALERIMKECFSDAAFVELDVLECNPVGKAFWARCGFKPLHHRMKTDR